MQNHVAVLLATALAATPAAAEIQGKQLEYEHDGTALVGYIAWDDAVTGPRPGVIVVHEWWGHNEHARRQAERLAKAGYVGLALDMYGKGKVTEHPEEAEAHPSGHSRGRNGTQTAVRPCEVVPHEMESYRMV